MKRPQVVGNKVVTRYTDVNSIVLKNYIEISQERLSKVRAGAQLTAVLRSSTAQGFRPRNTKETVETEKDLSPRTRLNSQKSNNDQVPISEFMENYLSQRNVNEELLATKENNIYSYFKEKFGLMGKYLGEDVLQEGLLMKSPNYRGEYNQDKMKKSKNFDHEKEQDLQNKERESPDHEGRTPKIVKINRDIMSQILKEEHQKEMDALINLQTQQNMQVFNDLQDIGMKDTDNKLSSTVRDRTPPEKMIVKSNFLRTFVNLGINENNLNGGDFLDDSAFRPRTTFHRTRPLTDHLIFRTKQKKENLLPNVDKISTRLDMHKFGTKMILAEGNNDANSTGYIIVNNQGISPIKARKETETSANNSSRPKFEIPRIDEENPIRPMSKSSKGFRPLRKAPSTSQAIRRVIKEEIEFLNEQRCPTRGGPQIYSYRAETNNDIEMTPSIKEIPDEDPSTNNEVIRPPLKNTTAKVTNTKNFGKKIAPFKVQTKISSLKGDMKIGTQVDGVVAEQISYYSPKVTGSSISVSGQPQMIKSQSVSKRDIKSFYSPPPRFKASQMKSLSVNNGIQPKGFVTKLVSVGKDESGHNMNSHFISGENFRSHKENGGNEVKEVTFNEKSSGSAKAALSQNSFGNRYWKNNFFY